MQLFARREHNIFIIVENYPYANTELLGVNVMEDAEIREHVFYKYADEVRDICKDLLVSTPVNLFCIGRAYDNGDYNALISDKMWTYNYLKNDFQQLGVEHQLASQGKSCYLWNLNLLKANCPKTKALLQACEQFKHGSGLVVSEKHADYKEVCFITTRYDPYQNDPYVMENIPFLKRFILYFKEQLYRNKKLLSAYSKIYKNSITENPVTIDHKTQLNLVIKKYYLGDAFRDIAFSQREAECLKYLHQGKTSKEIAKILLLSPRTVETHFNKIKQKTNCQSLRELMNKLEACALLDVIN